MSVRPGRQARQYTTFLGVDPGWSGGIALLRDPAICGPKDCCAFVTMPKDEQGIWTWLSAHCCPSDHCIAIVEKVSGYMPRDDKDADTGSSMFVFGHNYGAVRMGLVAAGVDAEDCIPLTWQKRLGIATRTRQETRGQWKARLKAECMRRLPSVLPTLHTADALLIALYCQQTYGVHHEQG